LEKQSSFRRINYDQVCVHYGSWFNNLPFHILIFNIWENETKSFTERMKKLGTVILFDSSEPQNDKFLSLVLRKNGTRNKQKREQKLQELQGNVIPI